MMFWMLPSVLACGSISADAWALTQETALRYGLEPELLAALVWQESRYCEEALSPKGAVGLGQLMPDTALELGVDPYDPVSNLDGAARYLAVQWQTFGRWDLALAAYNAGPNAVTTWGAIPPFEETQAYVPAVLESYRRFKTQTSPAVVTTGTPLPSLEGEPQGPNGPVEDAISPVSSPPTLPGGIPLTTEALRLVPRLIVFPERSTLARRLGR